MTSDEPAPNQVPAPGVPAASMEQSTGTTAQISPNQRGFGHHTARGFVWMLSQTLATKAIGTFGQFMLLALLTPEDIGVVGIAYAMSVGPVLLQQGGVRQVLVQRSHHFMRWANPAFWLSIFLGVAAAALMVALIPVAKLFFNEPRL